MKKKSDELTLDILFNSPIRMRILRMFLYNADRSFEPKYISNKLKIKPNLLNNHLKNLSALNFVIFKTINKKKFFKINKNFGFYNELKELIAKTTPVSKEKILSRIKILGKIKLVLLSGFFVNSDNSRADILIVGDNIRQFKFDKFLSDLEAEIGREINYALLTTKEFYYRYGMYDRFLRDLLEFKHEKLINKLKI